MDNIKNELEELNDRFIKLFRQKRYPEAIREAERGLKLAERLQYPNITYKKIFQDNLRSASLKYAGSARKYGGEKEEKGLSPDKSVSTREKVFGGMFLVISLVCAAFIFGFIILPYDSEDNFSYPQFALYTEPLSRSDVAAREKFISQNYELKKCVKIEAPLILQNPELPRGCEVTTLAMLLQYAGVSVDKMTLAREIVKEPALYRSENGRTYRGNPYDGFVGNMYSFEEPGYGVYHGPVKELMDKYMPGQTIDLTGCDFEDILIFLSQDVPVWVIVNSTFSKLGPARFETWHTQRGPLQITYREHAVLLTGYDRDAVYFNDPLHDTPNRKAGKESFQAAWEQMGKQAVTYLPY